MISRANRRIFALLGFSSAVHAGALLAYGYLYPSEPQVIFASPTFQLQLQPSLPQPTLSSTMPDNSTKEIKAPSPRVLMTQSQQAAFSTQSQPVVEVPVVPLLIEPLDRQPETPLLSIASVIGHSSAPALMQKVALSKTESDFAADANIDRPPTGSTSQPEAVVAEIAEPLLEKLVVASLAPGQSGPDPVTADGSSRADASIAFSASELQGSDSLDTIKHQLGEQLQHALESYFSYPLKARRKGWQGEVLLTVGIGRNGVVDSVRLASSSGYAVLDRAALKSMQQVAEIDLARLEMALADQSLQIDIPVAYRLLN